MLKPQMPSESPEILYIYIPTPLTLSLPPSLPSPFSQPHHSRLKLRSEPGTVSGDTFHLYCFSAAGARTHCTSWVSTGRTTLRPCLNCSGKPCPSTPSTDLTQRATQVRTLFCVYPSTDVHTGEDIILRQSGEDIFLRHCREAILLGQHIEDIILRHLK